MDRKSLETNTHTLKIIIIQILIVNMPTDRPVNILYIHIIYPCVKVANIYAAN